MEANNSRASSSKFAVGGPRPAGGGEQPRANVYVSNHEMGGSRTAVKANNSRANSSKLEVGGPRPAGGTEQPRAKVYVSNVEWGGPRTADAGE